MSKTTPSPSDPILGRGEQQGIKVSILKRHYLAAQALATNIQNLFLTKYHIGNLYHTICEEKDKFWEQVPATNK